MSRPRSTQPSFDRSIVEGPLLSAVWKLAWPTMLQNAIGGLQGMVDHMMVGNYVGFAANAAIGVSWQIFLVIIVFISSLYTGMGVLVARFAGANDPAKVGRVVYQAFLTSILLSGFVMAPIGYVASPYLLSLVNATQDVRAEALPYLRTLFVCSAGMLLFFMLGGALRSVGDAKTPLRLGVLMTFLNIGLNIALIRGIGPIPPLGTFGAALGTVLAGTIASGLGVWVLFTGRSVIRFDGVESRRPDWAIIQSLFRFGLPTGFQGIAMNIAGVMLLRFIGSLDRSAEAQAAYAVGYTELFSLVTWTSVGLMGATAAVAGQNLGAGRPERALLAASLASRIGLTVAIVIGGLFLTVPTLLLGLFGMTDRVVLELGRELLGYLSVSGLFITVALTYTGALQGTGDTRGPFYISLVSQIAVPLGICAVLQALGTLQASGVWTAIVVGHFTRCTLSVLRFRQGKWRDITVDIQPART
jgi:putative MATE family efflux protein